MKTKYRPVFILIAVLLASVAAFAADGESQYAKLNGAKIHYKSYGKGKDAVVFIHGWTCNLDNWREQIPEFAKRNRVIALDLPGHGQSDKPQIAYTMDLFANAVDAVMRDAKVDHAVLVGHSMGTPVARQFYRKYPQKTLAIVIVDGGLRLFGTKEMRDGFLAMFRAPTYKDAGAQMLGQMMANLPAAEQERGKTSFANTPQYVIVGAMEAMNDEALYTTDKINVPVFAILAKSPFWAADTDQFLHSLAPDLELQWWEGVGHFVMLEKPKQFNDAVIAFLNKKNLLK